LTPILLASLLSAAPATPAKAASPARNTLLAERTPARNTLLQEPTPAAVFSAGADAPEVGVPFGCGLAFPISQGHNVGSHLNYDTHAWDFRMPEGTPVVAAQDGVVRMARGDSTVGGCDMRFAPYANYVVVQHADGLETQYLHFSRVSVQAGQQVRRGELLGFSGETGWSCGAHLHFKVAQKRNNGWNNPSLPARIAGYGDPDRGTLIVAPNCNPASPDVILTQAPATPAQPEGGVQVARAQGAQPQAQPAGGQQGQGASEAPVLADAHGQPPVARPAGSKLEQVVEAVQDAAAAAATAVMPAGKGRN
jgi:hypothetical protein